MTQLSTTAFEEAHQTPPPVLSDKLPTLNVPPPARVNPINVALLVSHAQRTDVVPEVALNPCRIVTQGPWTLCTVMGMSRATRLVMPPSMTMPPVEYTPLVTSTMSPFVEASIAS